MSNETKRDVFDELLEISGNAMDQAMSAQYPSDENGCAPSGIGKAIRDILDPIEKRYDTALPDETDNQKSCPYCHEVDPQSKHAHYGKAISDKTEYFDFVRKTKLYRRVKARIKSPEDQHPKLCVTQMNRFREVSVVLDKEINYCPICGRKL